MMIFAGVFEQTLIAIEGSRVTQKDIDLAMAMDGFAALMSGGTGRG